VNVSLVMVTADGKTKELPPMHLPIVIGRSEEAKLRIPVAAVSRKHCELVEDDDELVVRDLKSSNGTYVNKERIKSRELVPGDLLCVGPAVLVVRIDGHPKAVDGIISWANGAVASGEGAEGDRPAMGGVPTWSGTAPAAAAKPAGPAKPAPKAPGKPKGGGDDLSSIIADLSESDFDIDFGEDDDKKPGPGGPGGKPGPAKK
jgi:predicted component of type VI protein secretion system